MVPEPETTVSVTLELSQRVARLLTVLTTGDYAPDDLHGVIMKLVDHAQQGIYRPGAWERGWLERAFGDEWENALEPDTDDLSADGRVIFQRPATPCPNDPPCEHGGSEHMKDATGAFCVADGCVCGDDFDEADSEGEDLSPSE